MPRKNGGIVGASNDVEEYAEVDETLVTTAPDDWEFETHTDQSPIAVVFDEKGDTFIGCFEEVRHIKPDKGDENDEFDLLIFRGRDGNPYSVTPGYKLERAFSPSNPKAIEPGTWCKITLVQLIDTGRKDNPMKDYKVETRK